MQNGQPPNGQPGESIPNGQSGQNNNGNSSPNVGEEELTEEELGKYVRNSSSYLNNFAFIYMTLLTLAIIL